MRASNGVVAGGVIFRARLAVSQWLLRLGARVEPPNRYQSRWNEDGTITIWQEPA